ncbi:nucleotide exchange factor GrpE [Gelidibacter sp. F63206]|uniref:nucleotide exchange factor GrpE n=1 Tax=Gelidibacter sp. F63206 TaxID=2926425 RepID=UPI001FF28534|nr:nucleotide exchange factor GrpE [Gelidibacter sp. F63206]MCK0114789.1 nucleotide exchange factor GrpE [Gelidibacter sp. F63206]
MSKKDKNEDIDINVEEAVNNAVNEDVNAEEVSVEDQLKEELGKEKDKFLRLFAEFENYKKRTTKERIELFKTAGQDVIQSLLPVLDDFDRAIHEISKIEKEDNELLKGVELIRNKFRSTLNSKGLEDIVVEVGEVFNADEHDAVTQIPAPSEDLKGKIVDVIEKGYKLGDKVIRFPKVITGF